MRTSKRETRLILQRVKLAVNLVNDEENDVRKIILTISIFLLLPAAQFAQRHRSVSKSAPQVRTFDEFLSDQIKGKKPQDRKITFPAEGGPLLINNVFRTAKFSQDERYLSYRISDEIEYSAGGGGSHFIIIVHGDERALLQTEVKFVNLLGVSKTAACSLRGDVDGILEYLGPPGGETRWVRSSFSWCGDPSQTPRSQ
jgi:hypothetical protein